MGKYSDREMLAFSSIAYEDSLRDYDKLVTNTAKYPDGKVPLSDLLSNETIQDISKTYKIEPSVIENWKVASSPGDRNGFFACVIETSNNEAAVAFRGSQDMFNPSAALTDWRHNLQLLNRTQTEQQVEADRFLEQNKELLQGYDRVGMTGHSLGGNLAEYSTIVANKHGIDGVVDQCVNLDGPGFNHDFINEHESDIASAESKITHYKWSMVGEIFDSKIGNVNYADTRYPDKIGLTWELEQHDRKYANRFDENGNLKTTDHAKGDLAGYVRDFTSALDDKPGWVRDLIYYRVGIPLIGILTGIGIVKETYEHVKDFVGDTINWVGDKVNKIKDGIANFFGNLFGGGGGGGHGFDKATMNSTLGIGLGNIVGGSGGGHSFGGGGRSFGGGGGANVIKVSTEEMAATIAKYQSERGRLMEAVSVCNNAAQMLARSWAGPSFMAMSIQMANTYKNLFQSINRVDDAIAELKATIGIMENTENKVKASVASLDIGTSPFA